MSYGYIAMLAQTFTRAENQLLKFIQFMVAHETLVGMGNDRLQSQLPYSDGLKYILKRCCKTSQYEQIVRRFLDTYKQYYLC